MIPAFMYLGDKLTPIGCERERLVFNVSGGMPPPRTTPRERRRLARTNSGPHRARCRSVPRGDEPWFSSVDIRQIILIRHVFGFEPGRYTAWLYLPEGEQPKREHTRDLAKALGLLPLANRIARSLSG